MSDQPIKILLVEDDEDNYVITRGILFRIKQWRFNLEWAKSYDDAVEAAQKKDYDVYLVDYYLGKENGLKFLRHLVSNHCKAPVIMLTGHENGQVDIEAMNAGASDYLVKGHFDPPLLERSIRYAIAQKKIEIDLLKREEQYRLLFEDNPHPMWVTDPETFSFLAVNNAAIQHYGYSREEFLSITIKDIRPKEEIAGLLNRWPGFKEKKLPLEKAGEWKHRKKDGTIFTVEVTISHISFLNKPALLVLAHDITERRHAEKRQSVQHAIVTALTEYTTLSEATPHILQLLCESWGWEFGSLWYVDPLVDELRSVDSWHLPSMTHLHEFGEMSRKLSFMAGEGLPGRVWADRVPMWIPDFSEKAVCPRAPIAGKLGLHGVCAFPLWDRTEILGVMEFLSREVRPIDDGLLITMADIGNQIGQFIQRKRAQDAVRESEARKAAILSSTLDCIITLDHRAHIVEVNPAAAQVFGYPIGTMVGKEMTELIFPPHQRERYRQGIRDYLQSGESPFVNKRFEMTATRADGTEFQVELTVTPIPLEGPAMFTNYLRDITERKKAEETIKHLAYYDTLTSLPNRVFLHELLSQWMNKEQYGNQPIGLLLIDLDRFKEINDTLGHHRGDLLLRQIGPRLKAALRPSDTIARMGGDEFGVLLPLSERRDATVVANKIIEALKEPFLIECLPISVEASIGIAISPDHGVTPDALIQRADVAMYLAKETNSGFIIYHPEQDRHSPRRLALMGELRYAIEKDQLFLLYQPKIDLKTNRVVGAEALIRWKHPERGVVPPDQFIIPAEKTGLIKPLTGWVLNAAFAQCMEWQKKGLKLKIAVNLSVRNIQDRRFYDQLLEIQKAHGISPDCIELEITESVIMADMAFAMERLTHLSEIGFQICIDDFGTGYSSLGYLSRLPVHQIKIDKSFVIQMKSDHNRAIVKSTIDLGHDLDLKVVAEGVETEMVLKELTALGCDVAQGYYISRPVPEDEFKTWLDKRPLSSESG
jgi:diguanylate cyclase (GGDEF)-like protein/PAS domain S-box-containing protein